MDAAISYIRGRDRNYMMRSEKRPGYPTNTPPKKPKKSVWYQILTIILLILFCPAGLILLWRRRLRWPGIVKLTATLLSLVMLFLELGAALWYPFKDERIRQLQHQASAVIDQAADACGEFFGDAADNWTAFMSNGREIGAAAGNHALGLLLDAIASPTPVPTQVPPMTLQQGGGNREGIAALMNNPTPSPTPSPTPTPTPTPEPTETPVPTDEPTATPTVQPEETIEASANVLERPTPSSGVNLTLDPNASATPVPPVTPTPTPEPTPIATETPEPTAEPTIDPASIPQLQHPGEATVWHTSDGKWYHKASVCGSMTNASEHTLASAVSKGKTACPYCYPFEEKWAREERPAVYLSSDGYWHTRMGCESNTDEWTIELLDDVLANASLRPCDACGARYYTDGVPSVPASETVPEASVTDAPTNAPGGTEEAVVPQLKAAGEIMVWHTSNGKWYHKGPSCGSMSNASQYTLKSAAAKGKTACPYCNPVGAEWANETKATVYVSSDSRWHTGPDCRANTDEWEPVLLSAALADSSLKACSECGANYYADGTAAVQGAVSAAETGIEDGLNLNNVTNGETVVYYSENTSHYHRYTMCASSATTTFVPHKLMDALLECKLACPVCNPPAPETK